MYAHENKDVELGFVPVELFQDPFDAHLVRRPAKLVHGMNNLQGFAEFPSTHTERDQHLKHAVIRLSALLPEISHHIKSCFSLVQACIALHSKGFFLFFLWV